MGTNDTEAYIMNEKSWKDMLPASHLPVAFIVCSRDDVAERSKTREPS